MTAPEQVSNIQLKGEPYQQTIVQDGEKFTVDCNRSLDVLAANAGYVDELPDRLADAAVDLGPLTEGDGYYGIDRKLKHGEDLSFAEAFSLTAFVCAALNRPLGEAFNGDIKNLGSAETHRLQAVALLAAMSTKEAYAHLTAPEIAGLVASVVHLDTVVRTQHQKEILAFGGMGGDKGYPLEGAESKLFSLSTLSAIALAADQPTYKHHSYPNTSKIAGQSAIESYGARSDFHSLEAFEKVLEDANLLMASCHNTRTLHTLSHALKGETINHIIGPLAFTLAAETPIQGFIGVNEKVHPQTIIEALRILDEKGYQRYDNSAVYAGTDLVSVPEGMLDADTYYHSPELKSHVRLDEVAPPPYASLVSFGVEGQPAGTYVVYPEDFYSDRELARVGLRDLVIPNTAEAILRFNTEALSGQDEAKARYLAMTIGLGTFVKEHVERSDALDLTNHRVNRKYLRAATEEGLDILRSGRAMNKLSEYVEVTQKYAGDSEELEKAA
jgi:anthranilate phosphoribosyltransferase